MATGICGFLDWTPAEQAEADRLCEEQRKQEAEAEKLAADFRTRCSDLDQLFSKYLREELAIELQVRPSERQMKDFGLYREFCARHWGLPPLPVMPEVLTEFLVCESEHGLAHISRLRNSISAVYRALNDPTEDIAIRALLRRAKREANEANSNQNVTERK